jgi:hypothetical protein
MNTWGYLILIAALFLLAAAMLYARFATRSREKSLHHAPVELMFPYETISAARPVENETGRINLTRGGKLGPEIKVDRALGVKGETKKRESDYFDELQEAAAGLAMLMRSSPVGRSEPVVFAPDEIENEVIEEVVAPEKIEEEVDIFRAGQVAATLPDVKEEHIADSADEIVEVNAPVEEEMVEEEVVATESAIVTETEAAVEAINPLMSDDEEGEVHLPVEVRVMTMREILGDQVSDRIDQIDEGLDSLEALVRNIESSLRALDSADLIYDDEDIADTHGAIVSEAA